LESESEIDTSGGGEPREEWRDEGEIGVGGVLGDEGVFNSGEFSGVRVKETGVGEWYFSQYLVYVGWRDG